jgi:hypothetical protein
MASSNRPSCDRRGRPNEGHHALVVGQSRRAELLVLERWSKFHREVLGFRPSWETGVLKRAERRTESLQQGNGLPEVV